VRSPEAVYISPECAVDSTPSTRPVAPSCDAPVVVRPVAVKLPLRVVSDRMNVDADLDSPPPPTTSSSSSSRRPGKPGARDVTVVAAAAAARLALDTHGENNTAACCDAGGGGGGVEAPSNSDDEVCDVFSRARRLQDVTDWLSCDVVDGRGCRVMGLLRALAAGGAAVHARSTAAAAAAVRSSGLARRWLHDGRSSAVVNAVVELPRPFLDFAKMQVYAQSAHLCPLSHS